MKLIVDEECCYYDLGNGKMLPVGVVFQEQDSYKRFADGLHWYADGYDGNDETDYFSNKPFNTKEQAIEHIDVTMKLIFKRILDEQ